MLVTSADGFDQALRELDRGGEARLDAADSMSRPRGRQTGRPTKTQIASGVRAGRRVKMVADRSKALDLARRQPARFAVNRALHSFILPFRPVTITEILWQRLMAVIISTVGGNIVDAIANGTDPAEAFASAGVEAAFDRGLALVGADLSPAARTSVLGIAKALVNSNELAQRIAQSAAVVALAAEARGKGSAPKPKSGSGQGKTREAEFDSELPWNRSAGAARVPGAAPQAPPRDPRRLPLRRGVAASFGAAFTRAVPPAALARLAASRGIPALAPRTLFVRRATSHFATAFLRLADGGRPPLQKPALLPLILAAIARAAPPLGVVPPARIPAMANAVADALARSLPALMRSLPARLQPARSQPAQSQPARPQPPIARRQAQREAPHFESTW